MIKYFEEFQIKFGEATKSIDKYYFNITAVKRKNPYYRERVYCYELYHKLRDALNDFPFTLQGEMDKNKHFILRPFKPDFILHEPKTMDNNFLVIEVKHIKNTAKSRLHKDLKSLLHFLDKGYFKAIHLIYGSIKESEKDISKVINAYKKYSKDDLKKYKDKLLLYWHKSCGEEATNYDWKKEVF